MTPTRLRPRLVLAGSLALLSGPLPAADDVPPAPDADAASARIARLFSPLRTDTASLSPDGKHLAYTEHEEGALNLIILALEPNRARRIPVADDFVVPMSGSKEKVPSRLTYLGWKNANRLIFSVNDYIIWAINADGTEPRRLIGSREVRTDWEEKRANNPYFDRMSRGGRRSGALGRQILTPDMDASVTEAQLFGSAFVTEESEEEEIDAEAAIPSIDTADVFSGFALAWNTDRHPVVANLLDDDPDYVLVEARSNTGLLDDAITLTGAEMSATLYRIHIRTGRQRMVEELDTANRLMADHNGKPRLALHYFNTARSYNYYDGRRWRKLDTLAPGLAEAPFRLTPERFLGRHSFPIGLDHDGHVLYYASNAGRDTFGIYGLNLKTGQPTDDAIEHPTLDLLNPAEAMRFNPLIYDRALKTVVGVRTQAATWPMTAWLDPELQAIQRGLEQGMEGRIVQIIEWDFKRENFLIHLSSGNDPGTFAIFHLATRKIVERAPCAPDLTADSLNPSRPFQFDNPAGVRIAGVFTYPLAPKLTPPPVVIYFHDGPWGRDVPGYNRGVQALATMGFAIIQVNYRGSSGYGLKHLTGARDGFDVAAVEDGLGALEYLSAQVPLNRRLVATLGSGFGGYLALRAVELHPDSLRTAVAINAPTDLSVWINQQTEHADSNAIGPHESFRSVVRRTMFGTDHARLRAMSPLTHAEAVKVPVLLIHGGQNRIVPSSHARRMRSALRKAEATVDYLELPSEGHANWRPATSTRVFRKIEMFVNEHIYNYNVKLGEPTPVGESAVESPPTP